MTKGLYIRTPETRKKMSESAKRVGFGKWMLGRKFSKETIEKMKNRKHSEETKKKMGNSHRGNKHHFFGKHLSEEHRKRLGLAHLKKHHSKETRIKIGIANRGKKHKPMSDVGKYNIKIAQINNHNRSFKNTGIELKIEAELQKRNINYQKQVPLCKTAIVDFYLPEYRTVIQCDGCFYHCCPTHYPQYHQDKKERDENQDKILTFNGFNIYRFWEHEINESVEKCINKIFIKEV